jgi:hypothetical protein
MPSLEHARLTRFVGVGFAALIAAADVPAQERTTQGEDEESPFELSEAKDPAALGLAVRNARAHVAALNKALNELKERLPAAAAHLRTHPKASDDDEQAVFSRYPALAVIGPYKGYRFEGFVTDLATLRKRVEEAQEQTAAATACLAYLGGDAAQTPAACRHAFLGCSVTVGSDEAGLYRMELTEEFALKRVDIESPAMFTPEIYQRLPKDGLRVQRELQGLQLQGCLAMRAFFPEWAPEAIYITQRQLLFGLSRDFDEFKDHCAIPRSEDGEHKALLALQRLYPGDKRLRQLVEAAERWCSSEANIQCRNVYPIRDTWALSYVTNGCAVRKVTVKDLIADVDGWSYATDAEKQEHLLLADRITACAAARKAGFEWAYEEPVLGGSCKPAQKHTKPAQQRPKPKAATPAKSPSVEL